MIENPKVQSVLITTIGDLQTFASDPAAWLAVQTATGKESWLLAYADDGVIWGKLKDNQLTLARDVFEKASPALSATTLQHLYLFGSEAEIHIWKDKQGFCGCCLKDGPDSAKETLDQALVLWGTRIYAGPDQGFTWMEDGSQGLRHAFPLEVPANLLNRDSQASPLKRPLRLTIRQYLDYDHDGQVFVTATRLTGLKVV